MRIGLVGLLTLLAGCVTQGANQRTWTRSRTACEPVVGDRQQCTETIEIEYRRSRSLPLFEAAKITAGVIGGTVLAGGALGGLTALGPDVKRVVELPVIREVSMFAIVGLFALGFSGMYAVVDKVFSLRDASYIDVQSRPFVLEVPPAPLSAPPLLDSISPPPLPEPSLAPD